jgi:hypothetical protein
VRKFFALLSVIGVVAALTLGPATASGNGGPCSKPGPAAHNPHCNGGNPGGHHPFFGGNRQSQNQQQSQSQSQRQCIIVIGLLQPANC